MLTLEDVEIEVKADMDILPIEGAFASGDEGFDNSVVKEIKERLSRGDVWAWADVEVKVSWEHWSASAYLGACSYENEEDFKKDNYYHQLVKDALKELNDRLKNDYNLLSNLVNR